VAGVVLVDPRRFGYAAGFVFVLAPKPLTDIRLDYLVLLRRTSRAPYWSVAEAGAVFSTNRRSRVRLN
jgi:hypothetical protein